MRLFGISLMIGFATTAALGDTVIWDNYSTGYNESWSSLLQSQAYGEHNFQVADDFIFTDGAYTITGVHWVGIWMGTAPEPHATGFNIYIYADDGTGDAPTGGGLDNPETTALASYSIPMADISETFTGLERYYDYDVLLPSSFEAAADTKYWIAIQAMLDELPGWGLARSLTIQETRARSGYPTAGTPYWSNAYGDASFYLTGVPEPSTLSLLALGGMMLLARCRRGAAQGQAFA